MLIDGSRHARKLEKQIKARIDPDDPPKLEIVLVGENDASAIYVRKKIEKAQEIGIEATLTKFDADASQDDILAAVKLANERAHGILIQLPLPEHINAQSIIEAVDPTKDVDGLHPHNLGTLMAGQPGLQPCTPAGVMHLLKEEDVTIKGAEVVIVGYGLIAGRPLATMLVHKGATVTVCHEFTKNLASHTKNADILVSATGVKHLIKPEMVKKGAVVIDVGIVRTKQGICGDVDPKVEEVAGKLTPVPGGVGPMTIAYVLKNTLEAKR